MTLYAAIIALLPYLFRLFSLFRSSGKDRDNLTDKLSRELRGREPAAYIVESLMARLHRMQPLPAAESLLVLRRDNAWQILRLLAPYRRIVIIISMKTEADKPVFCYDGMYSLRFVRWISRIVCGSLAGLFLYGVVVSDSVLLSCIHLYTAGVPEVGTTVLSGLSVLLCSLAYFMSATHALFLCLAGRRIRSLNLLLHPQESVSPYAWVRRLTIRKRTDDADPSDTYAVGKRDG